MSKFKKEKAVALKYNVEEDVAPVVIAAGYGEIADRIIDIAEQKGIPVFRDDSAASLMCMLEVGSTIPPELYEIVAAIYCQIMELSAEIKNNAKPSEDLRPSTALRRRAMEAARAAQEERRRDEGGDHNDNETQNG